MCCHKNLPAMSIAGRVYSDTRRTSRCVWSPYRIDMCADRIDMYAGRVLNGTGEGCPPFYPVISSPCIQKRCAAVVTSLSASNELHMIVCIQMFFVQKNFRLPDCIHCRPNAMRSPLLVPCPLSLFIGCFICLFVWSISYLVFHLLPYAYLAMPLCHTHASEYMRYTLCGVFSFFLCHAVHCFCISPFCHIFLIRPLGRGKVWGAKRGTDPFR